MNNNTVLKEKEIKICSLCEKYKGVDEFYYNKTHKRYLSQCKTCNNRRSQERRASFRDNNKDEYLKRRKNYNRETREQRTLYRKLYYENNKHEEYMRYQKRRHKIKGLEVNFSEVDWIHCIDYFNESCAYCGSGDELTKDHFIPLNKNGEYTTDNIVPACRSCNCSKKDDDFIEWYQKQSFYSVDRVKKVLVYLGYENKFQQLTST